MNRRLIQKTDTRCHECKKLFCCVKCRDSHESRKHPRAKSDSDCKLCSSKILPLKLSNDAKFLCHLVIRHLPLICVLCGQIYRESLDLENPSNCNFWAERRRNEDLAFKSSVKIPSQATPSPIVKTVSCPAISRRDSPSSDFEFHTLRSLVSPPELMRNTSTPMHVGVAGYRTNPQFNNKTPKPPTFFLKVSKTPTTNESNNPLVHLHGESIDGANTSSPSPSLAFYSARSQFFLPNSGDSNSDNSSSRIARNSLSGETPSKSLRRQSKEDCVRYSAGFSNRNSGQILEVMEEREEQASIEMDMTDVQGNVDMDSPIPDDPGIALAAATSTMNNRDSTKRVRFSDQNRTTADSTAEGVSVNEVFYEAEDMPDEETSEVGNKSADDRMIRENEDNSDKENLEGKNSGASEDASKAPPTLSSTSSSTLTSTSSRVVMMVVVENGFELSTRNLMPLISSSLQKIEKDKKPSGQNLDSPFTEVSTVAAAAAAAHSHLQRTASSSGTGVICRSVDSYNASSTIDYLYSTPAGNTDSLSPSSTRDDSRGIPVNVSAGNSIAGGIFSAMSHAVRSAFRALPGGINSAKSTSSPRGLEESFNVSSVSSGSSQASMNASSSNSFSSIATSLLRRPGKRTRDPMNDSIAAVHRREPRRNASDNGSSPAAKRPRSWHRIRGRDPIARMRRDPAANSTRGVSSETQHFQQGSLSVGDTIIPLPSRAHQSTQTD